MLNPATLLSANTGLSALLGGTVSAGTGAGNVATPGNQSVDFAALLSANTALAAAKAPIATLSPATIPDPSDEDASTAAPAAVCGKGLPLAALTAAVLPVPITLTALVDTPAAPAPQDDDAKPAPASAPDSVSPSAALLAAAQAATSAQPLMTAPTTPPTVNTASRPTTPAAPVAHRTSAAITPAMLAQVAPALAQAAPALGQPGFTPMPSSAATPDAPTTAATPGAMLAAVTASTNTAQPTVMLSADTAVAMADPSFLRTALAQPGFTLIPPSAATPDAPTTAATPGAMLAAVTASANTAQPTVTLSADTAVAMADPSFLRTALAQPGFSLFDPAGDASGTNAATGTVSLAAATAPVTLKADTAIAMADASYGPGITARPGFITQIAQTTTDAAAPAPTGTVPSAAPAPQGAASPGFATIQLAQATAPVATAQAEPAQTDPATPAPKVKLASARAAPVPGAQRLAPRADTVGDNTDTTLPHSPASQSADGASLMENAPSAIPQLASAGTTATAQTLAASGGAANPSALIATALATPPPASAPTDMAALVDRLVEARAAARSGLGAQSTMASVTHTDFGRVSLRFDQDDAGMNISMTSRDPGFAPAAQAALAQNPAVAASTQGHGAGQSGSQQNPGQQPGQPWTQASFQGGAASGGQSGANSGGQGWAQGGQTPQNQRNPVLQAQTGTAASTGDSGARRRGGILA